MADYNTQLQSNNTDLQAILEVLQNKAAGGSGGTGGTLETCQGVIDHLDDGHMPAPVCITVVRIDENGSPVTSTITALPETITCAKNSLVCMYDMSSSSEIGGDATVPYSNYADFTVFVSGDFTVHIPNY